jgi:hypothetical protein
MDSVAPNVAASKEAENSTSTSPHRRAYIPPRPVTPSTRISDHVSGGVRVADGVVVDIRVAVEFLRVGWSTHRAAVVPQPFGGGVAGRDGQDAHAWHNRVG